MNVRKLSEHLINNEDAVVKILESIGYQDIKYNSTRNELRFPREYGRNPSSCCLNLDTLTFICFSTGDKNNLYGLVMENKDLNFPKALKYVASELGLNQDELNVETKLPFGGFYKKFLREKRDSENYIETIDDGILEEYADKYNMMFFRDGINFQTQKKFCDGFDIMSNRITVPEYTPEGELCGIMGRSIDPFCDRSERWLPIVRCRRSLTLYGYHHNYASIQQKSMCVIGESEKFAQQLDSFDCHIGLSTCGCNVSPAQAKQIKGLFLDRVVLAYDEGLSEDQIRAEAEKIKVDNQIYVNRVGYIYDREHIVLPEGSKSSPSDYGRDKFSYLMKNCVVWI